MDNNINEYTELVEENENYKICIERTNKWANELKEQNESLVKANRELLEALKEHHEFLSLIIGSMSLERIERFDLLEKAKELFHKEAIKKHS